MTAKEDPQRPLCAAVAAALGDPGPAAENWAVRLSNVAAARNAEGRRARLALRIALLRLEGKPRATPPDDDFPALR